MATRELELQLRECAALYDEEVPRVHDFERRIMARVAITPREEGRRHTLKRDLLFSAAVAAAILGLAIAITAGVRLGFLHQPTAPAKHSQTQPSPQRGFAAAGGCPGWSTNPAPGTFFIASDKMTSRSIGWANGALRTNDGGAHWQNVAPNAMRAEAPQGTERTAYPPAYVDYFLDSNHAWLAFATPSPGSCFDHLTVFATVDGGRQWQRSRSIDAAIQADSSLQLQLAFIDPRHGWLFVLGSGRLTPDWFVYTTTDGGLDWQRLSQISVSSFCSVQFISDSVGFLGNCPNIMGPSPQLTVTRDGGKTWQTVDLPAQGASQYTVSQPVFFDATRGAAQVTAEIAQGNTLTPLVYLVVTTDGGQTWRALPKLSIAGSVHVLAFIDSNHFVALVSGPPDSIYLTSDGGLTWTAVGQLPVLDPTYPEVMFIDSQHGFIDGPSQQIGQGPTGFLATGDGGRTWKDLHPQVSGG